MGPNKGRRVRKIEIPTDSVHEFELGDIQRRREERVAREREESQQQIEEKARREEATAEETHSQDEVVAGKGPGQRKMTVKQRVEERQDHHSHNTRRGT